MKLKQNIMGQFKNPHGLIGKVAGFVMANRSSNVERNMWTIKLLDLKPTDRLLEIGYGPGLAIEAASKRITEGLIVGLDHSETMLHQAKKRNQEAIQQGLVELYLGTIDTLPAQCKLFDKIFSANVVQFWPNPTETFRKLKTLLAPGGIISTTYMPRHSSATNQDGERKAKEIEVQLKTAGFHQINIEVLPMKPISAYSVVAINHAQ